MKRVFFKLSYLLFFICLFAGCSLLSKRPPYKPAVGEKIVQIAAQYHGTPYLYGGATPNGFDCSGFSSFVFKKAGIGIPRIVKEQYNAGKSVSRSDLRKGDLVFFMNWQYIGFLLPPSHVGIYTGNNKFIHAPKSGSKVRYDSLNNPYWNSHYKGAKDLTQVRQRFFKYIVISVIYRILTLFFLTTFFSQRCPDFYSFQRLFFYFQRVINLLLPDCRRCTVSHIYCGIIFRFKCSGHSNMR